MKKAITVHSQTEFNEIPPDFNGQVIVDCKLTVCITAKSNLEVFARGDTSIFAEDNEFVEIHAYDNSTVEVHGSETVSAYDDSTILAYGNSTVYAYHTSSIIAWDYSYCCSPRKTRKMQKAAKARF